MEYRCETRSDRFVVSISGILTFHDHIEFRKIMTEFSECAPMKIEFSLATMQMIDSAGIGMLLLANDKAGQIGKSLCLTGVTGHVAKIVELAKVDRVISIE